jgi:hypothetical protein
VRAVLARVGAAGLAGLALIAAAVTFHAWVQVPIEQELRTLERAVVRDHAVSPVMRVSTPAAQIGSFYRFFEQPAAAHEWLAKLHAIARAAGLELPSAEYRLLPTGTRIARYQITVPLSATYSQARAFMANALNEIPVLSVDQASFRRSHAGDSRLEVEIVMTLHVLEL